MTFPTGFGARRWGDCLFLNAGTAGRMLCKGLTWQYEFLREEPCRRRSSALELLMRVAAGGPMLRSDDGDEQRRSVLMQEAVSVDIWSRAYAIVATMCRQWMSIQ